MSSPRRPSAADLTAASYYKSSHSGANNACVEIAQLGPSWVGVRDSKDPAGPALCFEADAFTAFLADVRHGRFAS